MRRSRRSRCSWISPRIPIRISNFFGLWGNGALCHSPVTVPNLLQMIFKDADIDRLARAGTDFHRCTVIVRATMGESSFYQAFLRKFDRVPVFWLRPWEIQPHN